MRRLALGAALFAAGVAAAAQKPEYRVEVRLVEVEARVTDGQRRPVIGLSRDDFTLQENGVRHDVATVSYVTGAEQTLPVPAESRNANTPAFVTAAPPPTWVCIVTETDPADVSRVLNALRHFISAQLRPGFRVSIGGRRFTDDRQQLLEIVERLARSPYGTDDGPGVVDPTRVHQQESEEERAMATDMLKQEEGVVPIAGFVSRPESIEQNSEGSRPFLSENRIDRQLPMYGEVALRRYEALVDMLSPLPGKKVVVLLKPALRLEPDNVPALRRIASRAALSRVSFYTTNSRGLEPLIPTADRVVPLGLDRRRRFSVDVAGLIEQRELSQEGLTALAVTTNGRDVRAGNDLRHIFDAVVHDASGYYVLGYYPIDLAAAGRYRRIQVSVRRPDTKIDATRGYYEPSGSITSQGDKGLSLRKAVLAELPTDLPVAATTAMFAAGDGSPAFVLSAGVRAGALKPAPGEGAPHLEARALVRIASDDESKPPMYLERTLSSKADPKQWEAVQRDSRALVALNDVVMLRPGTHTWRIVFRDEHSGRLGGVEGRITVPDYRTGTALSTVLMTSEVLQRADEAADGDDVLDLGRLRFSPQPTRVFKQGEMVHLLFDVYNPAAEDLAQGSLGPRMALLHEGRPVSGAVVQGEGFPEPSRRRIRYACVIATRDLTPGSYTVLVSPPRQDPAHAKPLVQVFLLLPS
jgi:VWFA-related protein